MSVTSLIVDSEKEFKMNKILDRIRCELENKTIEESVMLVIVVQASGSTPRKPGAMMLVGAEGILEGTIGGGLIEYECINRAKCLLAVGESGKETFVLDNTKAGALGMVCGGKTEVQFIYVTLEMLPQLEAMVNEVLSAAGLSLEEGRNRIFLIGGGHVALELSKLLDYLEFTYVLIEEREEFATIERFPNAMERIVCSLDEVEETCKELGLYPGDKDGFCILTRGHEGDTKALRYALQSQASYIGAMGSRRKRQAVFTQLESEGWMDVEQRVETPIGLDIGGETPEELAISIVARLVQWRSS